MKHLKRNFCYWGNSLYSLAKKMIEEAKKLNESVCFELNGVTVIAHPKGSDVNSIERRYDREFERQYKKRKESPEGKALALKERAENKESLRIERKAIAQGIVPFKIRNRNLWAKVVEENKKDMMRMLRFTSRWAQIMEMEIAENKKLSRIAKKASHKANSEGLSGSEFECALEILCGVWRHGKELRRHYYHGRT